MIVGCSRSGRCCLDRKPQNLPGRRTAQALTEVIQVGDDEDCKNGALRCDQTEHPNATPVWMEVLCSGQGNGRSSHECRWRLFVFPVRIVRVLHVPERATALNHGRRAKLYSGGGDVVDHSSVQASHGSRPARFPLRSDQRMLARKQRIPRA